VSVDGGVVDTALNIFILLLRDVDSLIVNKAFRYPKVYDPSLGVLDPEVVWLDVFVNITKSVYFFDRFKLFKSDSSDLGVSSWGRQTFYVVDTGLVQVLKDKETSAFYCVMQDVTSSSLQRVLFQEETLAKYSITSFTVYRVELDGHCPICLGVVILADLALTSAADKLLELKAAIFKLQRV
jgi:hypothetical protein